MSHRHTLGGIRTRRLSNITASVEPGMLSFEGLGVDRSLLPQLKALGIREPSEIQAKSFGAFLSSDAGVLEKTMYIRAPTGTGKTLAFLLPLLTSILQKPEPKIPHVHTLIVVPTKELAQQIQGIIGQVLPPSR
jgi:superfamily II DNA/RNA helicase